MISYVRLKMLNYSFAADDNTISFTEKSLEELIKSLTSESEKAVQCFVENTMIVNPDKFQVIFIDSKKQQNNPTSIKIDDIYTSTLKIA